MELRLIEDLSDADLVAELAVCLTNEIIERTGIQHFDVDVEKAKRLCREYVSSGDYWVIVARQEELVIGFGALCESRSLYAEGAFGIVQEFYVMPEYRSSGVGARLLDALAEYGQRQNWMRLELCTPPVPEFDRTVDFYKRNGFEITGGYKMKKAL